jgi:chromosomal replication initiation ATPase DnaA
VIQLAFDLDHRPALGREDFLVTESNAQAVDWIDRWPDWPATALVLVGPNGSGKSHLAQVWRSASGAAVFDPSDRPRQTLRDWLGERRACLFDDAERMAGRADLERATFDLYNLLAERDGRLLLTGRRPPARWPVLLPDLGSRLSTAMPVELGLPDDALMRALIIKLFADRQLLPGRGVVDYLVLRMERSQAMAREVVAAIDRHGLRDRREVRLPLARDVLAACEAKTTTKGEQDGSGA